MPSHRSTSSAAPRRTHGIMARLVRLAAGVLVVTLVVAAFTAFGQSTAADGHTHHCIHDRLQQRVFDSVARRPLAMSAVSAIGLPYVEVAADAAGSSESPSSDVMSSEDSAPTESSEAASSAPDSQSSSDSGDVARSAEWGDMRITVSALDLTDPEYHCSEVGQVISDRDGYEVVCEEDDILTDEKRDILVNYLIPQALQMHMDRLQVKQVQDAWKVTGMVGETCEEFKVPEEHVATGVNNTDFVLYVASVPTDYGVLAWATVCQVFSNLQPAVGVINIPAAFIAAPYDQYMIHTVTHEIAHALGFSGGFFTALGMGQRVYGVRGKDYIVPVINSTNVVEKTRQHYGCDSAEQMELEDAGGSGTMGSHWKIRNAAEELMAGVAGVAYYTNLTMAAFEDLGFYKANYSKAETMKWGRDQGCSLLNGKCVIDNVTQFPSMFCDTDERVFRCQPSRMRLGTCVLSQYSTLPEYFQYFTVPTIGGRSFYYDYCPYVVQWGIGSCTQDESDADEYVAGFNTFSMSSRCIDGSFMPKDNGGSSVTEYYGMCTRLTCDPATETYSVYVKGSSGYVNCTAGDVIQLSTISDAFEDGGYITCPPYMEVCQSNVQAIRDYEYGPSTTTSTTTTTAAPTTTSTTTTTTTTPAPSTTSAPTTSAAPTEAPTSTAAPGSQSSSAAASSSAASSNTTSTATPDSSANATSSRGNAACGLRSPRAAAAALLALLLAAVAL